VLICSPTLAPPPHWYRCAARSLAAHSLAAAHSCWPLLARAHSLAAHPPPGCGLSCPGSPTDSPTCGSPDVRIPRRAGLPGSAAELPPGRRCL